MTGDTPQLLSERYGDAVAALTGLMRALAEDESVSDTLQSILKLVLRALPGCHAASVTVLDAEGRPSTMAATDEQTLQMDQRQYALHDGPCLDAARRQQVNRWSLGWPARQRLAAAAEGSAAARYERRVKADVEEIRERAHR